MGNDDELLPDPPEGYTAKGLGGAYAEGLENEVGNPDDRIATPRPTGNGGSTRPPDVVCRRRSPEPLQGRLPLGPPGRGAGFKDAPQPTAGGFAAARQRETDRTRPRSDEELRERDLAKLRALLDEYEDLGPAEDWDEGLTDTELDAFPDMFARLERGRFPLSERQRAWVDKVVDRLGVEVPEEPEIGGEYKRPPPAAVTPAHAKAQAYLAGDRDEADQLDRQAVEDRVQPKRDAPMASQLEKLWRALGPLADHFLGHDDRWLSFELVDGRAAYPLVRTDRHVLAYVTTEGRELVVDRGSGDSLARFKSPPTLANLAAAVMGLGHNSHPAIVPVARKLGIVASSPHAGEKLGIFQVEKRGYMNRDDYAESGDECTRHETCQLIRQHEGDCDDRTEQERWQALHGALDAGKDGPALEEAMKPPMTSQKPSKAEPMPPPLGVRTEQRKRRRIT